MELRDLMNNAPFAELLGIEVIDIGDGHATGRLEFSDDIRSNSYGEVAHGGATYALADTIGGAAVVSLSRDISPTVDMRIDYLAPVTCDLRATAEVVRHGSSISVAHVNIHDDNGTRVATAHGTYKTSGQGDDTPWYGEDGPGERRETDQQE
jgi:uncharacterized protein (TIGR00369 family)